MGAALTKLHEATLPDRARRREQPNRSSGLARTWEGGIASLIIRLMEDS